MNVISFSVWGNDPFYVKGISENIALAEEYYPGWKCKIYYDSSFNINVISDELKSRAIFEYVPHTRGVWDGLFWRFAPASDPNVDIMIVRDLDSRINSRECAAVNDWLQSPYDFHGMRDHYQHNVRIMGGMWGCRNKILSNMNELINRWPDFNNKGADQEFLSNVIWPLIIGKELFHDRYANSLYITPEKDWFTQDDIAEYNAFDWCGEEGNSQFPIGKVVFKNGKTYRRDQIYEYRPLKFFGPHNVKHFPNHPAMKDGLFVGDYIK